MLEACCFLKGNEGGGDLGRGDVRGVEGGEIGVVIYSEQKVNFLSGE